MPPKKSIKETLGEIHKDAMENAKSLADDSDMDGNPAVRAQFENLASDHGVHLASKTEYAIGGYIMGAIASAVRKITGKENVLVEYPLLTALVGAFPIFGTLIAAFGFPQGMKSLLYFFADMIFLFFLPIYPFYMLYKFIDMYVIMKRFKAGKKLRDWEWFWS